MTNNKGYLINTNGDKIYPDSYDTGWIKVTQFYNGASHFNEAGNPVRYRKIGNEVFLAGLLKAGYGASGTTDRGLQFILPEGFRPSGNYNCWITRHGTGTVRCLVNGSSISGYVALEDATAGLETPLSVVNFIAEY